MEFSVDDLPAVKALGPLFKLTEVHLWDDGSSEAQELTYFPEPVKLIDGDDKDCEKTKIGRINGFSLAPEDVELAKELSDMGLPLSFHTNKEMRYGVGSGKNKGTRKKNQPSHTEADVLMPIEDENRFHTSVIDDTKMLDQSETLKNCTVEEIDELSNLSLEHGDSVNSTACTSTLTNDHDYNGEISSIIEFECENYEGIHETEGQLNGDSVDVMEVSEHANSNVTVYWDDFYKRTYFYNMETGESTWDPPPGMGHLVFGDVACEETSKLDEVQPCNGTTGSGLSADDVSVSAKRKKQSRRTKISRRFSVSSGDIQGFVQEDVPPSISKYWCQRYQLFSRFDRGIQMDEEGWFSVTPEALAKHHALRCGYGSIVDFFTGVGGNAIQFAQRSKHVIAIDIDPNKIDYARHNAAIYGVDDNIDFIKGDSFSLAPMLKANTVYMSPPWGGPGYSKVKKFDINMIKPRDGQSLFDAGKSIAPRMVMFLPRNVDVNQLAELSLSATPPWSLEVEMNYINGRLKAVTAYFLKPAFDK